MPPSARRRSRDCHLTGHVRIVACDQIVEVRMGPGQRVPQYRHRERPRRQGLLLGRSVGPSEQIGTLSQQFAVHGYERIGPAHRARQPRRVDPPPDVQWILTPQGQEAQEQAGARRLADVMAVDPPGPVREPVVGRQAPVGRVEAHGGDVLDTPPVEPGPIDASAEGAVRATLDQRRIRCTVAAGHRDNLPGAPDRLTAGGGVLHRSRIRARPRSAHPLSRPGALWDNGGVAGTGTGSGAPPGGGTHPRLGRT